MKKANVNDVKEQYHTWITGRAAALENLDSVVINLTWRTYNRRYQKVQPKIGVGNSEKPSLAMPWRNVEMSRSMKQAKWQWLQNPSDMLGVFVNITQYDSGRLCRSLYLEGKINELKSCHKNTRHVMYQLLKWCIFCFLYFSFLHLRFNLVLLHFGLYFNSTLKMNTNTKMMWIIHVQVVCTVQH